MPSSWTRRDKRKHSKSISLRVHATARARERFGLRGRDLWWFVKAIQGRPEARHIPVEFVEKQSNRVSVFCVTYKEVDIIAVYDRVRKLIITVIEPEVWGSADENS